MTAARRATLALALAAATAAPAGAHGLDPALLSLRETAPGRFAVLWRSAAQRLPGVDVRPDLPARCRRVDAGTATTTLEHVSLEWTVDCGPGDLAGETFAVRDLDAARINALLVIERRSGAPVRSVLNGRTPAFVVPARASAVEVVRSYGRLGIEHILSGADHLLFVTGLLLLVASTRLLLQTITAFTLGHSVTLSAAALGWTSVPARAIEVWIAASVLVLAVELARPAGPTTLLRRFPWAMAALFGLLHGFGFAGALREAGLPADDVPLALVSFNAGIETGQLLFVAAILAAAALAARRAPALAVRARGPAVYAMGVLAAFWCFERVAVWLA
jgi:hydrogenase/urease accessory protein HupE